MKRASAEGLFYMRNFMKPSNWEMKSYSKESKKRYVLWNACFHPAWNAFFHHGVDEAANANDVPEILSQHFKYLNCFAGDSPEEAIEKWIFGLFNGKESLSTIRMHAAIEGEDIP